jgi:hypothetical protein
VAISFGFKPYSTIGYNYTTASNEVYRDELTGELVRNTTNYQGQGGLKQVFLGLGWKPFANFSVGANVGLLWGGYDHVMMQVFTEGGATSSSFDGFNFMQHADVLTYKLDFGAQYAFRVSPKDWLTIGATVGLGHKFDGDAFLYSKKGTYNEKQRQAYQNDPFRTVSGSCVRNAVPYRSDPGNRRYALPYASASFTLRLYLRPRLGTYGRRGRSALPFSYPRYATILSDCPLYGIRACGIRCGIGTYA